MIRLTFKKRKATDKVFIVFNNCERAKFDTVYRNARRKGEYDTGFHFYIDINGYVTSDRELNDVAQYDFICSETSVYVLVDAPDNDSMSDAQLASLNKTITMLRETFKGVDIITTKSED